MSTSLLDAAAELATRLINALCSQLFALRIEDDVLPHPVIAYEAHEPIGDLYCYQIRIEIEPNTFPTHGCGRRATLIQVSAEGQRFIHGILTHIAFEDDGKSKSYARLSLQPWVWYLSQNQNTRIFQDQNIPSILSKVFADAGLPSDEFHLALAAAYDKHSYCVQYQESDWNFCKRLMEAEGIHAYFVHDTTKTILHLCDHNSAHASITGLASLAYLPDVGRSYAQEHLSSFVIHQQIQPDTMSVNDQSFEKPALILFTSANTKHPQHAIERYEHGAHYTHPHQGMQMAKRRLQEQQSAETLAFGKSNCMRISPGYTFRISGHSRFDGEYFIIKATHHGRQPSAEAAIGDDESSYENSFEAIPVSLHFRPARHTPKPRVQGAERAQVCGPEGEEIYTDRHGRLKVQFYWDRLGQKNEHSSCWMRMVQSWAGAGYGALFLPRIGQEVMIGFEEGDPDRPFVLGPLYDGTRMSPYELPKSRTRGGIKSLSTPGGETYNEIAFEDAAGNEELILYAGRDQRQNVERNREDKVGKNSSSSVGLDRAESTGGHRKSSVLGNNEESIAGYQSIGVAGYEKISIGADQHIAVGAGQILGIAANQNLQIGANQSVQIGANQSVQIGANQTTSIGANQSFSIGGDHSSDVGGNDSKNAGANSALIAGAQISRHAGADISDSAGANYALDAAVNISLGAGADITLKCSGILRLEASQIVLIAPSILEQGAAGTLAVDSGGVSANGAKVEAGGGSVELVGGTVKLN